MDSSVARNISPVAMELTISRKNKKPDPGPWTEPSDDSHCPVEFCARVMQDEARGLTQGRSEYREGEDGEQEERASEFSSTCSEPWDPPGPPGGLRRIGVEMPVHFTPLTEKHGQSTSLERLGSLRSRRPTVTMPPRTPEHSVIE
jgi:hypothetical protein